MRGTYAIAVVSEKCPGMIVAAKNASPLVVGYGEGESFLASDVPAILDHTRLVNYLEEGELAVLTAQGHPHRGPGGTPGRAQPPRRIEWSAVAAEKDGHKHFMHKEICEQPRAVADTIRGRISLEEGDVLLDGLEHRRRVRPEHRPAGDRRLRDELARRALRAPHDRGLGAAAGGSRARERVPPP